MSYTSVIVEINSVTYLSSEYTSYAYITSPYLFLYNYYFISIFTSN